MDSTKGSESTKVRVGEPKDCYWKTVKTTEGQMGSVKVETKQIEVDKNKYSKQDFIKELIGISGIGKKTAEDIIKYVKSGKELMKKIASGEGLPFRDDVEIKLREYYGQRS